MAAPNIETPEGRATIAGSALRGYAEGLRRASRGRAYAGPRNAGPRENLREWAKAADELAEGLRSGRLSLDETFEGSGS